MARTRKEVDPTAYQAAINRLEAKGPFKNHSFLFKAVVADHWGKSNGITVSVATSRFFELGLKSKTQPGRITEASKLRGSETAPEEPEEIDPTDPSNEELEASGIEPEPSKEWVEPKPVKMGKIDPDFFEPFTRRGLKPECLEDLVSSTSKTDEENIAIFDGWYEVTQRVIGRVPSKDYLIEMYRRNGLPVPKRISQFLERLHGNPVPPKGDNEFYPRPEFIREK